MNTSDNINELATALAAAQAEMKNAAFNRVNPHFKSKYADLAGVRDTVTPSLTKHGIGVVQGTLMKDGSLLVFTKLLHKSGQWVESHYPVIADVSKPQAMGSAMTYARRYSLAAICGIASEEDDDGNEAQEHGKKAPELRAVNGTPGASKASARADYSALVGEMRSCQTLESLKDWRDLRIKEINALPADWIEELRVDYEDHRDGLKAKVMA